MKRIVALLTLAMLLVTACGGDSDAAPEAGAPGSDTILVYSSPL
jgi:ABC-type glycerol-3-phosphate transport system substrate-binding protein